MEIHIGDRIADITLVGKEGNKVQLTIDGKPYEVDIVMAENGSCSILHNGNSFNAGLVRGEGGKSYDISMLQRSFHVDIVDTQAKYLHMNKTAASIVEILHCRPHKRRTFVRVRSARKLIKQNECSAFGFYFGKNAVKMNGMRLRR